MTRDMASDQPDGPDGLDAVEDLVKGLWTSVGGDEEEFEEMMDEQLGEDRGRNTAAAALGGLQLGQDLAEQRRQLRERGPRGADRRDAGAGAGDVPPVQVREIEQDGQFVGLRVLCSDPDASLFSSPDGELLIEAGGARERHPVGFDVGDVRAIESDNLSEWIVEPAGAGGGGLEGRQTGADMIGPEEAESGDEGAQDDPAAGSSGDEPQGSTGEDGVDDDGEPER